jgi:hypothetical protein
MNTITKLLSTSLLAIACGAPDFEPEDQGQGQDLGTAEQGMSAKASQNFQFGVASGDARFQCDRTNTLQVCSVPSTRNFTFFIDPAGFGPPGSGFNDEIYKYVDQLADQLAPEWTFTEVFSATPEPTMIFNNSPCSGASSSVSIAAFSCMGLDNLTSSVTEGSGIVGSYRVHSDCNINIDMDDINQRGETTIEELRLLRHATGHATLACIGLGGRTDSGANAFASRMLVDVNFSPATISTGERCRAKSFSSGNNSVFNLITPSCAGN